MFITLRSVTIALGISFICFGSSFVAAQDVSIDVNAEATVNVGPNRPGERPKTPIQMMREKQKDAKQGVRMEKKELREDRMEFKAGAEEARQGIREDRREFMKDTLMERKEMHVDVKAALEAATTPEERQAILKNAREDRAAFRVRVKADAEVLRADFKERRGGIRDERRELVGEHLSAVMRRLVNALERFDQILARIDARIEKLRAEGGDVAAAIAASATASASIDAASSAVANAHASIEVAATADTPREHIDAVRAAVRAAIDAVKAAHRALKDALMAIKDLARPAAAVEASVETEVSIEAQ